MKHASHPMHSTCGVFTALACAFQVIVEGYDGQLPKLDMYNMLRMAAKHSTKLKVKPRAEHTQPLWVLKPVLDMTKVWWFGVRSAERACCLIWCCSRHCEFLNIEVDPEACAG